MKRWLYLMLIMSAVFIISACGNNEETEDDGTIEEPVVVEEEESKDNKDESEQDADTSDENQTEMVTVDLNNADGEKVGTAELEEAETGVTVKLDAENIPAGTHGLHFHEVGKCEAPDFESAGSHFNPTEASHGVEHEQGPHAGDLPNLEVGEDGTVQEEITAEQVTLKEGEENSLLSEEGTALVIHDKADDNKSQPSGEAGDRIVCGEIKK